MRILLILAIQYACALNVCATVHPGDKYTVDGSGSVCVPFGDDD